MYFNVQLSNWLSGGFNGTKLRVLAHTIHSYVNKGSLGTSFHWPILTVVEKNPLFCFSVSQGMELHKGTRNGFPIYARL